MAPRFAVTISRPLRQVIIPTEMTSPTPSEQPRPVGDLGQVRAEERDLDGEEQGAEPDASFHIAVRHRERATARNSSVLRMNVPVTATP